MKEDPVIPAPLTGTIETVIRVPWLTYAHHQEAGKVGLGQFLADKYGADEELELLEAGNDTDFEVDVSTPSEFDKEWAERDKELILKKLRTNTLEEYRLRQVLMRAVLDGHLPPARYLINLSW